MTSRRRKDMEPLKGAIVSLVGVGFLISGSFAAQQSPEERGKALFNDPKLAGATSGKSCNSCHQNGKGLEHAAHKQEFKKLGKVQKSLEEIINFSIEQMLKGKPIDPKSQQMKDLVAYIKSLSSQLKPEAPGY
jgi:cytochrome c